MTQHPARHRRAAGLLGLLLLTLLCLPVAPAAAHNVLRSSSPASGEHLPAPPREVRLEFTDDVIELGTQVAVTGPAGPVETGQALVAGTEVTAVLPAGLPAGGYEVAWRASSADGHPISGTFSFTAEAAAPTPAAPAASAPAPSPPVSATSAPATPTAAAPKDSGGGTPPALWVALGAALAVGAGAAGIARRRRG
jgi:methionine-rich copper-binding protein CopC